MPKTKLQKQEILRDLAEKVKNAKSVVFATFNALGVKDNEELRKKLREAGGEYYVAKKTLFNLAFKENKNLPELNVRELDGKVAAVFGYEDEVTPAKIVAGFKKTHQDSINFLGGVLENKILTANEVVSLSQLPSKQELYAKMVGSLNAPVSGFVNVLAGNLRGLVTVLKAISDKK